MYLNFFDLKKEPFQITPDPSFLYLSPGHKEALASIMYGVEKKKGFVLIIGSVGVGKTTILKAYLERAEKERLRTIYLFNANLSYANLLKYILTELGIMPQSDKICEMVSQLQQALIKEYQEGRNVLLFIDEAQNMPIDTLENLRMLSNFETATEKLIQIIFSAQSEFEKTLNLNELKQLKQRIAVKATISPLTEKEGLLYIQHRLKRAAEKESVIFTPYALKEIVRTAKGIPRIINVICDNSLITAFGYGRKKVGLGVVKEITRDFGMLRPLYVRRYIKFLMAALVAMSAAYLGLTAWSPERPALATAVIKIPQRSAAAPSETLSADKGKTVTVAEKALDNRVVERGDTLAKLIKDVYGHADSRTLRLVKKANPHIENENLIIEGSRIVFPVKKWN